MAYVISDDCIACGACAAECPCEAISEGDGKYVIDADACAGCGSCASVCPVGAPQGSLSKDLKLNTYITAVVITVVFFYYNNFEKP